MIRLAQLVVLAALTGAANASAAQPAPPNAGPKEAAQGDADFVLPPPHGSPKQLATGGTRGLAMQPQSDGGSDTQAAARPGPRPLTGTRQP